MESQFRLSSRVTRPAFPPLSTHQDPIFSAAPSSWDPRHLGSNLVPIPIRIVSVKPLRCLNSASDFNFMGVNEKHRPVIETTRKKLAVFVSGGGSNFRAIHEACFKGSVPGDVVVLVTNKKDCGGAEYARNHDIPVILFPKTKVESNGVSPVELVDVLRGYGVEFVLLAGFLKLIPAALIRAFPKCILNIHPSLLPAFGGKGFYGMKVHKAVLASGARYSGPTIHFVNEEYDTGRILAQRAVPVLADDTPEKLAARVLHEEHRLYVEVIGALCEGRIKWRDDGVPLIRSKENPNEVGCVCSKFCSNLSVLLIEPRLFFDPFGQNDSMVADVVWFSTQNF